MKKIIAFNGSPRKRWNTSTLLEKALEGAASKGANTKLIDLYDLKYDGCISCFACKTLGGKSYGRCIIKDDLAPILEEIEKADGLIFGSPIYLGSLTGKMKSFLERLIFAHLTYILPNNGTLFPKKIPTVFIYTMGVSKDGMKERGYDKTIGQMEGYLSLIFGSTETLWCFDTYQFEDYSKVFAPRFDVEKKLASRQEVFPIDCQKAFEIGVRLFT